MDLTKPRLLDLFCGAGGAAMGYHLAGFEVVGVDIRPQKRYPFEFIQMDALDWTDFAGFQAVHASPPCQAHSITRNLWPGREHPDLIEATRALCNISGLPYMIENVQGAPLREPIKLCGSMFGLDVRRHRLFESNLFLMSLKCQHHLQTPRFVTQRGRGHKSQQRLASVVNVSGHDSSFTDTHYMASVVHVHGHSSNSKGGGVDVWRRAMGIDWMVRDELSEAIPPAYTEFIGNQVLAILRSQN